MSNQTRPSGTVTLGPGEEWLHAEFNYVRQESEENDLTKAIELARKNEGRCVKCGTLRKMSIHGLLECEVCGG